MFFTKADATVLTSKNITEAVQKDISKQASNLVKGKINIQVNNVPFEQLKIPDGSYKINTVVNMPYFTPATVVRVEVTVNDKVIDSFGVPVRISVTDKVLVATDRINIGETLTNSNVQFQDKDITQLAQSSAREDALSGNVITKKVFRSGEIIDTRYTESIPDVIRDNQVNLIFNSDLINITVTGTALENGKVGDFIRVRNVKYKKEYVGRIINRNTVQVNI